MKEIIEIDISTIYKDTETAKVSMLETYIQKVKQMAGNGNVVVITGAGPIWLYLKIAHALHGVAKKLIYRSPVTGDIVIFDHSPD